MFRILFFGDVIGSLGRRAVVEILPRLRETYGPDFVIANVENLAHGTGVTAKTLQELVNAGVHAFTGGNHSWGNPLGRPLFEDSAWRDRLIAPTNYGASQGGSNVLTIGSGEKRVAVVNIIGQLFMHPETRSPFEALDRTLQNLTDPPKTIIVDFHAEATAEKEAFGHFADGRVSAVLGTHTHVATADAKILPGGTAYVTDVGRCGAHDSVIGFEKKSVVKRYLQQSRTPYDLPTQGQTEVNAIVLTVDLDTGRVSTLDRIREIIDISAEK